MHLNDRYNEASREVFVAIINSKNYKQDETITKLANEYTLFKIDPRYNLDLTCVVLVFRKAKKQSAKWKEYELK